MKNMESCQLSTIRKGKEDKESYLEELVGNTSKGASFVAIYLLLHDDI